MTDLELGRIALGHLELAVRIDSASDERSQTIPSTPGQAVLADAVGVFFEGLGATVERDDFANVIATLPGRGVGVGQAPIALMIHLDTARGTATLDTLNVSEPWDGGNINFVKNPTLEVGVASYPSTREFLGQHLVYGGGDVPFGLDDKLGLCHMMTLARLLHDDQTVSHPPILFIGRPDEEIGREDAILGLAKTLAARGVDFGYTVDGILPFEINVENYNAAHASLSFPATALPGTPTAAFEVFFGGVNTHGCTAKAEGHRAATRLAWETLQRLEAQGWAPRQLAPVSMTPDALRDCDATVRFLVWPGPKGDVAAAEAALRVAVEAVVGPHLPRGASWRVKATDDTTGGRAIYDTLHWIGRFISDDAVSPLLAEDSEGREGYSHPYRATSGEAGVVLDVRIRDFDTAGLAARKAQIERLVPEGVSCELHDQYENMAPRLASRPELVSWPKAAAEKVGVTPRVFPIRGGTGVDPFLDVGVPIANLGTGYFAPESEKEFTSLELMARHARWLLALVEEIAKARAESLG